MVKTSFRNVESNKVELSNFSQHHLLKRLSFLHCVFLAPLSKIICPYTCGFISGLSILFHWSMSLVFLPILCCFDYCHSVM